MTVEPIAVVPDDSLTEGVWRYREPRSGCVFIVAFPSAMPALWDRYLQGALRVYRRFGVDGALEYEQVRDGTSTSLFFIAIDARDAPAFLIERGDDYGIHDGSCERWRRSKEHGRQKNDCTEWANAASPACDCICRPRLG